MVEMKHNCITPGKNGEKEEKGETERYAGKKGGRDEMKEEKNKINVTLLY